MEKSKSYPTVKEVVLISDLLKGEELLFKKAQLNSKLTVNEELKKELERLKEQHKKRFLSLYSLL